MQEHCYVVWIEREKPLECDCLVLLVESRYENDGDTRDKNKSLKMITKFALEQKQ